MNEIPGPAIDVKGQGSALFPYLLSDFCHLLPPSVPHPWPLTFTQTTTKKNANLQRPIYVLLFKFFRKNGQSPRSSLNFGNIVVRLQTLLLNHLPLLHLPHTQILSLERRSNPCRELNVVLLHFLVAQCYGWGKREVCVKAHLILSPETTDFPHCLQIRHSDVGWTLGYMLNLTNMIPAEQPVSTPLTHSTYVSLMVLFSLILVAVIFIGLIIFHKPSYFRKDRV